MGLPGDLGTVILTGEFLDPAGNPMRGTVTIQPNATLLDATGNVIVSQIPRAYQLFNGSFRTAPLVGTDNTDINPSGWTYLITIALQEVPSYSFNVALPSSGSPVDLSTLSPAQSIPELAGSLPVTGGTLTGKLTLTGSTPLQIPSGAVAGDVLTSDASGNASWSSVSADGIATASALTAETTRAEAAEATLTASIPALPVTVAHGGTGQGTQQAAINALTGSQSAGHYLRSDGTNASLAAIQAADVPTLNQNTTGTAAGLSSTLAIGSGGTGSTTRNFSGLLTQTATKTSAYTAAAGDFVCVDTTSAAVTITLPNAPADLTVVAVKMTASAATPNAVTIACAGSDVFNKAGGSTSLSLTLVEQSAVLQYQHSAGIWLKQTGDVPLAQADLRYRRSVSIAEYGALTSASDNGAAINAAITALGSAGGVIYIPPGGTYQFSTAISLASATSVTIQGLTAPGAGASMASTLTWTGTGSGSAINCQNSNGVRFRDLAILYSSSSFTGNLLDFRNVSGSDTSYGLVENCYLGGSGGITTATTLVNLDKCINMTIRKTNLAGAVYGIYGKSLSSTYSNAVTIQDCVFHGQSSFHIYNAGQAWLIDGCTFEGLSGGTAGAYAHDSGNNADGLTIRGCWTGDTTGGTQFTVSGNSVCFLGNWIGAGSGTCIYTDDVVAGFLVSGNDFVDCTVALETVQPSGSASALAWFITGNSYTGVTTRLSGNFASGTFYHDGQAQSSSSGHGLTVYGMNMNGALGMFDGQNITTGTTTGTKIGTSTSQKVGFWNTAPITQPTVSGASLTPAMQSVLTALANAGLIVNSAGSPVIAVSDVPTLNQNTSGTAANITGPLSSVPVPTAAVSLNSQKITSLANGSAASDAAAFGQIPLIDSTATDLVAPGIQAAGALGKVADAGHVHLGAAETPGTRGLLAWTFDPKNIGIELTMGTFASGSIILTKVWLYKPATISTITLWIGAQIGTTLTSGQNFAGLYDSTGTQRGVTADQTTAWTTTGNKNTGLAMSLTSPYTNAPAGFYWIALLCNYTGTGTAVTPLVAASNASNSGGVNLGLTAATACAGFISGSATTLPGTITPSSIGIGHGASWPFLAALS